MNKLLILPLLLLVSACASVGNSDFANSDKARKVIIANITSPEQLVAEYGQPQQIFTKNGEQVYEYRHISVTGIPDGEYTTGARHYKLDYVYVYFDEGILTRVENISRRGKYPPEDIFAPYLKQ
ncbi:MAG: hypothetical protein Q4D11_06385 [Rhodospirillales bacterium]|nr:hypothetical protein [Rhodospirillales bacterium]